MQGEQKFFIGMQDTGADYKASNKCLLEMMSNVATLHAMKVGQSAMQVGSSSMVWMVINWKLEVIKRPMACETVTARTWAVKYNKLHAQRDLEIFDRNGELMAKASSLWVAVDPGHASFVKLNEENMGVYQCEPGKESFPDSSFTRIREKDYHVLNGADVRIIRSMIDCNDHVHNTAYLDLVNEVLPDGVDESMFDQVEINYRKEARLHDKVVVDYAAKGENGTDVNANHANQADPCCIFIRSEDRSVLHASVLLS